MKNSIVFASIIAVLFACKGSKEVVNQGLTEQDYAYIRTFHKAVRAKNAGLNAEALQLFDSCFTARPTDDAAAYAISQLLLKENQLAKSAEYIEKAAQLDPKNAWYTQELAYMYYNQKRFPESAKAFEKLVTDQPRNIELWYAYSEVLKQNKENEKAIMALNKMEDQLGIIPDLSIEKYQLYLQLKQEEKAINELKKARVKHPEDLNLIGTLVDYYFSKNKISEAQEMLVEFVKNEPKNVRANIALADLYWRQNKKTEAYPYFKNAFTYDGLDIDTKVNALMMIYEQSQSGIDPQAFELAQLTVDKHPNDPKSLNVMADFLLLSKRNKEALGYLTKALALDDTKYQLWNQILVLEYEQREFDSLYVHGRRASALFPSLPKMQLFYTVACVQTKRFVEAIDAAEMGKELVVNDPRLEAEFWSQRGEALFLSGKLKEGAESYSKALELDPKNLVTRNNFSRRLAYSEYDLEKAKRLSTELIIEQPGVAAFNSVNSLVLFKLKNYADALTFAKKAIEIDSADPNAFDILGDIYSLQGNSGLALENWKKAQDLGGKNKNLPKKIQTNKYVAPEF